MESNGFFEKKKKETLELDIWQKVEIDVVPYFPVDYTIDYI